MARSLSPRSRSRSPRKVERRRERDSRGDRERERDRGHERERDRDWEIRNRGDRGRLGERDRDRGGRDDRGERGDRIQRTDRGDRGDRADRGDRGRKRERERGRSGSPRHDHERTHSDEYDTRRDGRASGRNRDTGTDFLETEKLHKKGNDRKEDEVAKDSEGQRAAIVAEFVDGIVREHEQLTEASLNAPQTLPAPSSPAVINPDEEDLMKKMGIPVGFGTTKGKYVGDANHSAVKLTTKRTPRQYMNRRGGFNRPLPAETNR